MNNLFTIQESIAEVQITYSSKIKSTDRIKITSSFEAEKAFRLFWPSFEHVEFAYLLLLNRQNQIIGNFFLAKGGITGTVVDVRVIFQVALKANATSIMPITTQAVIYRFPMQIGRSHGKLRSLFS